MNAALPRTPNISARDRLITTLFFAVLVHAIVILGIGFTAGNPGGSSTLEVTLVQTRSVVPPAQADYIAQSNQRGQGNTRKLVRPQSPLSMPSAVNNSGLPEGEDLVSNPGHGEGASDAHGLSNAAVDQQAAVTTVADTGQTANARAMPAPQSPSARVLVARLLTQGDDALMPTDDPVQLPLATSPTPREAFVAVNARASRYAEYLDAWRRKIEHIGNLNFPPQIHAEHLSGSLALEVALNADGSIRDLILRKPSPHPLLDQSAIQIVKMAAPFAPFPESFRKDTNVLRFVYVWRFNGGRLDTRRGGLELPAPH
ncbi:MAG: TonB family protein [Gammaproteobacteria bacterium]|nr:TonB family protein [Gammaproteobacteria bacterium]MBU6509042.1 TonB family protein [Gammaproteobacteria bacterium]MDE1983520.1 TonB family protein [Gammaproteobacteria bacterium]MDE2107949.1 TonB family protein [Gammaproteobacteria bacterium]MDE2460007.1 TonB family protein [Gammaproteobacteria bacterium]